MQKVLENLTKFKEFKLTYIKMKILSFDVGIINLAYCIFDSETNKILKWGIIDLKVHNFSATVPSGRASIAQAANDIHITLIKCLDSLSILLDVDYVVIEKQPSFNPKMRIIGGCLQSYFYIRGIVDKTSEKITSIEFFSPKHKLKCYTGPKLTIKSKAKSKYTQTKKMGILIAQAKLDEFNEIHEFKQLFQTSKKQDDLADCYLQAITFCLFKKFKKINQNEVVNQNQIVNQNQNEVVNQIPKTVTVTKLLTKAQIKRQLKEYFDKQVNQNELQKNLQETEYNLQKLLESIDPFLKLSIFTKYRIKDFTNMDFLIDLSMKSYTKQFYNLPL